MGGVHPNDNKLAKNEAFEVFPLPKQATIFMGQHLGAPATPAVQKGDKVKVGQLIGKAEAFMCANIHSPFSGTVNKVDMVADITGYKKTAVVIDVEGDEWMEGIDTSSELKTEITLSKQEIINRMKECGIVGLGGACFPTHIKYMLKPEQKVDYLLINAAECEPYLTADDRLIRDHAEKVLGGAAIAAKILKISRIVVGIENNKPEAVEALSALSQKYSAEIVPLPVRYPQGGEKQLIYALTARKVVAGGLPMDVGCVVQNVGTLAAIYEAVTEGHPLIERVVTVTGTPLVNPGNFLLRLGTPVGRALEFAGGIKSPVGKLILGGPMMGFAQSSTDVAVTKNTSGILLLGADEVRQFEAGPCLSCGRCVDACPMRLLVSTLSKVCENERYDLAEENYVMSCLECGICTYVCPAGRPNVQHFRRAKAEINARRRKK